MIGIYNIWNMNVDTAELVNNRGGSVEINASIIIKFDVVKIF